jgi:hypothetical protein
MMHQELNFDFARQRLPLYKSIKHSNTYYRFANYNGPVLSNYYTLALNPSYNLEKLPGTTFSGKRNAYLVSNSKEISLKVDCNGLKPLKYKAELIYARRQ